MGGTGDKVSNHVNGVGAQDTECRSEQAVQGLAGAGLSETYSYAAVNQTDVLNRALKKQVQATFPFCHV